MSKECDHEWEYVKDWRKELKFGGLGETIEIPQKCSKCGLKGCEVWIYSCVVDKKGKEIC